ncbi:MAG: Nif3-like dinuclear metal center hexameric protein [Solirubrobacterales bacterium]
MTRMGDLFEVLEEIAPSWLAEPWDHSGLQTGCRDDRVNGVLVALDADAGSVTAALSAGANLIICHHPLLFKPVNTIDYGEPLGALLALLCRERITVFAAHTNLDAAPAGLNQYLAERIGFGEIGLLGITSREPLVKMAVFVPEDAAESVRMAIDAAGAGHIGKYSGCTFNSRGNGTFRPLENARPAIGKIGELTVVPEIKVETVVRESALPRVLQAMLKAHPYEEAAYDLVPLNRQDIPYSYGRKGVLVQERRLEELAADVKASLGLASVRIVGARDRKIKRVALVSGAGASMIGTAVREQCDVLITGDLKYHDAQEALAHGLTLIDAGHDGMEKAAVTLLGDWLDQAKTNRGWDFPLVRHRSDTVFQAL